MRHWIAGFAAVMALGGASPEEAAAQARFRAPRVRSTATGTTSGRSVSALGRGAVRTRAAVPEASSGRRRSAAAEGDSPRRRRAAAETDGTRGRGASRVRGGGGNGGRRRGSGPVDTGDNARRRVALSHVGADRWRTPAGLNLTKASFRRLLSHGRNRDVGRPHGVFDAGRRGALSVVDEAFRIAKRGGSRVTKRNEGSRQVIEVDMGRSVGYIGGVVRGRPEARHVRLIVSGNGSDLHSAYPFRPLNRTHPNPTDFGDNNRRGGQGNEEGLTTRQYRRQGLGNDERNEIRPRGRNWNRVRVPDRAHPDQAPAITTVARQLRDAYGDTNLAPATARRAADHVATGMPTAAGRSNPNDYIIAHNGYVTSYNRERRVPNWVGYRVTPDNVSNERFRSDDFRSDPTLPRTWTVADIHDYRNSGFHRGHVVSSGSRLDSVRENSKTFVMTNIVPQAPANNTGAWRTFEHHVRTLANNGHEVQVFAGPGFQGSRAHTIGENRVAVPDFMWKVAVVTRPGQSLSAIDSDTRVIALKIPNTNRVGGDAAPYRTSVAEIEQATGFRFFTNLPRDVANTLRSRVDAEDLGPPPPPPGR